MMYKIIILWVFVIIILVAIVFYLKQVLLYRPIPHTVAKHDFKYQKFFQRLGKMVEDRKYILNKFVKTSDGEALDTIYINNPYSKQCIILFHGNYGNLSILYRLINHLYTYASVVCFDYRSFGRSSGNRYLLSSEKLFLDANAIWDYTLTLNYEPSHITLYGESLGCSVATHLAYQLALKNVKIHALILLSPFYSLDSVINDVLKKIHLQILSPFIKLISGHDYRTYEWIGEVAKIDKVVIVHSLEDRLIPIYQAQELFSLIKDKGASFIEIRGGHGEPKLSPEYIYGMAQLFDV